MAWTISVASRGRLYPGLRREVGCCSNTAGTRVTPRAACSSTPDSRRHSLPRTWSSATGSAAAADPADLTRASHRARDELREPGQDCTADLRQVQAGHGEYFF